MSASGKESVLVFQRPVREVHSSATATCASTHLWCVMAFRTVSFPGMKATAKVNLFCSSVSQWLVSYCTTCAPGPQLPIPWNVPGLLLCNFPPWPHRTVRICQCWTTDTISLKWALGSVAANPSSVMDLQCLSAVYWHLDLFVQLLIMSFGFSVKALNSSWTHSEWPDEEWQQVNNVCALTASKYAHLLSFFVSYITLIIQRKGVKVFFTTSQRLMGQSFACPQGWCSSSSSSPSWCKSNSQGKRSLEQVNISSLIGGKHFH